MKEIIIDYYPYSIGGRLRFNYEFSDRFKNWKSCLLLEEIPKTSNEVVVVKYKNEIVKIYYKGE